MPTAKAPPLFVPLGVGMDTGIDDKLLPLGKVPSLVNCFVDRTGEVVKRGGTTALTTATTPGAGVLGVNWQLATYKNALIDLQVTGPTSIFSYSPMANQWPMVGDPPPLTATDAALSSGIFSRVSTGRIPVATSVPQPNTTPDVAYANGYYFACYAEITSQTAAMRVIDSVTGQVVYKWSVTSIGGIAPRVIVTGSYVSLLYVDPVAQTISADVWLISTDFDAGAGNPTTYSLADGFFTPAPGVGFVCFDVINTSATTLAIAYATSIGTTRRINFTPSTGATTSVAVTTAAAAAINSSQCLNWVQDLGNSARLSLITAGPAGLAVHWGLTAGLPATTFVLDAGATVNVRSCTGHTISGNATGEFNVIYDVWASGTEFWRRKIRFAARTVAAGVSAGDWLKSCGITSKTMIVSGFYYAIVNYESGSSVGATQQIQSSFFLVRVPTDALSHPRQTGPQARIAMWQSAGVDANFQSHPTSVALLSSAKFAAAISVAVGTTTNLTAGTGSGTDLVTLEFNKILGPAREAADALYVPGGVLGAFYGSSYEEDGFSIYPEQPTYTTSAGGGLTTGATYVYRLVYTFVDETGRKHRSAPSIPIVASLLAPAPNGFVFPVMALATTQPLPACTAAGAGIAKTLTETVGSGQGLFIDGVAAPFIGSPLILVKDQAVTADNGVYQLAHDGLATGAGNAWRLQRWANYAGINGHPAAGDVLNVAGPTQRAGGAPPVAAGTLNSHKQFALQGAGPFVIDVSNLVFAPSTIAQTITLAVPTLGLTTRRVKIEVYRSQANQSTGLTLVGTVDNGSGGGTLPFVDTFSDVAISTGDPIYTDIGIESQPAPGLSYVFAAKDRLFGISMDNPSELWFTDQFIPGEAPRWNETQTVLISDERGPLIAGAGVDDKVVVFKGDATYAFNGDGPDIVGRGAFVNPQTVAVGVGCSNQQSVAAMKDGIFFRSSSANVGIKMIDRSLAIIDIGGEVRAYDNSTIVAAMFVPATDQIRFVLSDTAVTSLIYDVVLKQWSTFTYPAFGDVFGHAVPWNGTVAFAPQSPPFHVEDQTRSVWTDDGETFPMIVTSPWVQVSGVRGFSRLHRVQGVGVTVASVPLTAQLYLDFDATTVVGTYVGTPPAAWNWEMIPRVQRGSAFRLVLTESSPTEGFKISGFTMLLGLKSGLGRQGSGKRLVGQ